MCFKSLKHVPCTFISDTQNCVICQKYGSSILDKKHFFIQLSQDHSDSVLNEENIANWTFVKNINLKYQKHKTFLELMNNCLRLSLNNLNFQIFGPQQPTHRHLLGQLGSRWRRKDRRWTRKTRHPRLLARNLNW